MNRGIEVIVKTTTKSMRGYNPRDKWKLKLHLLERMLSKGYVKPAKSLNRATIRDWFPTREEALADEIVEELLDDPDAPIEYSATDVQAIWLTDADEGRSFKRDLDENPDWFDDSRDRPF